MKMNWEATALFESNDIFEFLKQNALIKRRNLKILRTCLDGKWILYWRMKSVNRGSIKWIKMMAYYNRAKNICEEIKDRIRSDR